MRTSASTAALIMFLLRVLLASRSLSNVRSRYVIASWAINFNSGTPKRSAV